LDDLIIVPLLIWLALKLIPVEVMRQAREQAVERMNSNQAKPTSYVGLLFVLIIWLICLVSLLHWLKQSF
jgi:membrane protein required for beta-lactamase induction